LTGFVTLQGSNPAPALDGQAHSWAPVGLDQEVQQMIRNRRNRRLVVAALIVVGALLLLLAPSVHYGLVAFGLGVAIELAGIAIERRGPP